MGKRSKNMRDRLLVGILSLAMLLTGVTMPAGTRKAQAAEINLTVATGSQMSGSNVAMQLNKDNEYATEYIHDVIFNIPEQAQSKSALESNGVKSMEVKLTVTGCSGQNTRAMLYVMSESWAWNATDGKECAQGQQITLTYDFSSMDWGSKTDMGKMALRFAGDTADCKISYTINSAKLITSGGSGSTGEDQTDWEVQNNDLKLSYTAEDLYDAYTEYKFTLQNNGSGNVSGALIVTFDQARERNWWTEDYSISLTNGGKAVQVTNLSVSAGGSTGPIQIQLKPQGAKITSVTFAGKTIAAELSSGGGGGSTINPDLELEYNFAKAFQYSLYLYDANMCGPEVKEDTAFTWRGNCHTEDQTATYNGKTVDVSGGYHDAGDHAKFNLPQAYSASTLGMGYYEFKDAFIELGQDEHMKIIMDRFAKYFENCTVLDSNGKVEAYCYQVGDAGSDHAYWGAPENQPSRKGNAHFTSSSTPCTDIVGETAAALAIYAVNYKTADKAASDQALKYAKALFEYAESNAKGNSWVSGIYESKNWKDDMALASIWLYNATNDSSYLTKYNDYVQGCSTGWVMCWDDVSAAAYLYGGKPDSTRAIINSQKSKTSPQGFVYVDGSWGSARYNTALQLMGLSVDKENNTSDYQAWALGQMQYLMGSNKDKRNFIVGYNENSPKYIHHRAASGYNDVNSNATTPLKYTVYGALAGGPNDQDKYTDMANAYQYSEVAIDYNAGFVGALAGLYLQEKDGDFKDDQQLATSKTGEMEGVSTYYGEETVDPDATPRPTKTPKPSSSAKPSQTPIPGSSTKPSQTPTPSSSAKPSQTPTPGSSTKPSQTPTPGSSTKPSSTPKPSSSVKPSSTPKPSSSVKPSQTPKPSSSVKPSQTPTLGSSAKPSQTPTPGSSANPSQTPTPGSSMNPSQTPTPGSSMEPSQTPTPGSSANPSQTPIPDSSAKPSQTPIPDSSSSPGASNTPGSTNPPDSTDDPYASQSPQASDAPGTGNIAGLITDPNIAISNGWSGVDAALAEQTIMSQKSDKDIAGSTFGVLKLRATKTAKNSVKLKWNAVAGASKYIVYGNCCGNNNTLQKLATVTGTSWTHNSLKKGTYYKYLVTACQTIDGVDVTLGISKMVHATTLGGKTVNAKKVTVKKAKVILKKGKSFKIKAKQVPLKKKNKIAMHRKISYESSNPAIATVSSSGKIKAKKKGKCNIYVYAQNGLYKQVKVTVK